MKTFYQISKRLAVISAMLFLGLTAKSSAQVLTCEAGFYYNVGANGVVIFYDSSYASSGTITSSAWYFGDGTTGTGNQVVHTYNGTGPYTVCYFITTSTGCSDSTCMQVFLNTNPCNLIANIVPDSINNTLTVYASSGNAPYAYSWSTGQTSSTITATNPGTYCVTVVDANGCGATDCYVVGPNGSTCQVVFTNTTTPANNVVTFVASISGAATNVIWNFGDGTTGAGINVVHTYAVSGSYTVCATAFDSIGNACSTYCQVITIGNSSGNAVACGNIFNDLNANAVQENNEPGMAGQNLYIWGNGLQLSAVTDSLGNYQFNLAAGSYTIYYCAQFPYSLTVPQDSGNCAFYSFTIGANDTICGFNFGVVQNTVVISGTIFSDDNGNGIMDGVEGGIPYQSVQVGTSWTYTDGNGDYTAYKPTGTYTISYAPSGAYAPYPLTTPGTISVAATTAGTTYANNNFGIAIPAGSTNLSVSLNPHTTVTPGFGAWYDIQVCNVGVTPAASTLTMVYDAGLTLDYANPAPASNNTTTHTLTWNLSLLTPGNCKYIWVDFNAATTMVLGTNTLEMVNVLPTSGNDIDMSNNIDTVHQIVVGSWDPNNKLAIATNYNDPAYQVVSTINADQSIDYTINFQNLGTASAVNIVVIDELSSDVDAASYQFLGASHNSMVSRVGNTVTYQFKNIYLPDATANEPMSHGFVKYRINAINNLPAGNQISDFANIYFDFNAPVTTNNAIITMIVPSGINDVKANNVAVNSYPNPVNAAAQIQFELKATAQVDVAIIDATGRISSQLISDKLNSGVQKISFDAAPLANGIYTIRLTVDGKTSFTKITVAH